MNLQVKPTLIIIGTLLIGMVLGALILGTLAEKRHERIRKMMGPGKFTERLLDVIQPENDEQRDNIIAVAESTTLKIDRMMRESRDEIRAMVDSMTVELRPFLSEDQNARLQKHIGDGWRRGERMKHHGMPPGSPPGGPPADFPGDHP